MEFEVKEYKPLTDGVHTGVITRIEYRTEPHKYTDIFIKEDSEQIELKYGCPTPLALTKKNMLGKLVQAFIKLVPGTRINLESALVDKKVSFVTRIEKTEAGEFTWVVTNSVKPADL